MPSDENGGGADKAEDGEGHESGCDDNAASAASDDLSDKGDSGVKSRPVGEGVVEDSINGMFDKTVLSGEGNNADCDGMSSATAVAVAVGEECDTILDGHVQRSP